MIGDYLDYNGDTCERICTVECTEEQIKCEVEQTATGCLQNDVCIHKGFSNDGITLCDGFCPVAMDFGPVAMDFGPVASTSQDAYICT